MGDGGAGSRQRDVLIVGIYLIDVENNAPGIVAELATSADWTVTQHWIGLGKRPVPAELLDVTIEHTDELIPKFVLLNRLLARLPLDEYAYVIVCDDDIELPAGFLDRYLACVRTHDLALCQPARTHESYIDHPFVEQLDGLTARWTRFVEIGPLFSIRREAVPLLIPFDEASPMGWGYDFVWPCVMESAGLRMGIVDATPIAHSLRKSVTHYQHGTASKSMDAYLSSREHLAKGDAFFVVESYA